MGVRVCGARYSVRASRKEEEQEERMWTMKKETTGIPSSPLAVGGKFGTLRVKEKIKEEEEEEKGGDGWVRRLGQKRNATRHEVVRRTTKPGSNSKKQQHIEATYCTEKAKEEQD